jgi:hypothetical protein
MLTFRSSTFPLDAARFSFTIASWSSPLVFHSCCRFSGRLLLTNISVSSSLLVLIFSDFARRCRVLAFFCVASSSAPCCETKIICQIILPYCRDCHCRSNLFFRNRLNIRRRYSSAPGFTGKALTFAGALPLANRVTCLSSP